MPAFNRFYNPSQSRYQSQFVPENLPVDLMAKTLYAKQGKADQMMAAAVKLGDWDQDALGWHDTEYVKGIKKEIEQFTQEAMGEDRTSPEFQRKYLELTNRIKNDENLEKVQGAVNTHAEYQKRHAELTKMGNEAAADALEADYLYRLGEYTKEGGEGFKGMSLGDANIRKGTNVYKDGLEFFSALKADGSDKVAFLGTGMAYKKGWEGISDPKVQAQAKRQYELWRKTDGGEQQYQEELQKLGYVNTTLADLPKDERKTIQEQVDSNLKNTFLEIGRTVVYGKATTNMDMALRAQRKEDQEKEIGVVIPTAEKVFSKNTTFADRDKAIKDKTKQVEALAQKIRIAEQKIKNGVNSGYTAEGLAALKKSEASARRQVQLLKEEKNEDWQKISNAQKGIVQKEYDAATAARKKAFDSIPKELLASLPEDDRLFLEELAAQKGSASTNQLTGYLTLDSFIGEIIESVQHDPKYADLRVGLRQMQNAEKKINNIDSRAANLTRKIWQDNYNTAGASKSSIQMSGASVRTDANSTMAAVNGDIVSNSEAYSFYSADGKVITIDQITKFNGESVTSGDFRNKGQIGINGTITYKTPKLDAEGNVVRASDGTGSIQYETKTTAVNAVPHGAHVQFLKNNWAREQEEVARIKEAQGKFEEAAVARGHAMNLNSQSLYQELIDFQSDDASVTTIATSAYSADGKTSGTAEFILKKVGTVGAGGGYQIKYGNITEELPDMNAVNSYVQTLTNSSTPK